VEPHLTDLRENWDNLSHGPTFTEPNEDEKKAAREKLEAERKKQEEDKRKKEEKAKADAEEAKAKQEGESAQKTENAKEEDKKASERKGEDFHQQRQDRQNPTEEQSKPKDEDQRVKGDLPKENNSTDEKKQLQPRAWTTSPSPWESLSLCRAECERDASCFQYVYIEQPNSPKQCKLGKSFRLGKYLPPGKDGHVIWTSGWMVERIRKWTKEHACKGIEWPDIKAA